jgi:hypothetical protein
VRSSIKSSAGPAAGKLRIAALLIAGVPTQLEGAVATAALAGQDKQLPVTYIASTGVVKIEDINLDVGQAFELNWSI